MPGSGRYRHLRNRAVVSAAVLTGHVAVFGLMALELRPPPRLSGNDGTVVMASLVSAVPGAHTAPPPAPKPVHRAQPAKPEPAPASDAKAPAPAVTPDTAQAPQLDEAETEAVAAFDGGAVAAGDPDASCDLTAALGASFRASPQVRQALDELPADQRSVANAINLWDGAWPAETLSGGKGLLRALLVKAVGAAPPECLIRDNHGPALMFVPENGTVAVLAVGSGTWRWGDLTQAAAENGEIPAAPASEIARLP